VDAVEEEEEEEVVVLPNKINSNNSGRLLLRYYVAVVFEASVVDPMAIRTAAVQMNLLNKKNTKKIMQTKKGCSP
jgi:hypothetical protein